MEKRSTASRVLSARPRSYKAESDEVERGGLRFLPDWESDGERGGEGGGGGGGE